MENELWGNQFMLQMPNIHDLSIVESIMMHIHVPREKAFSFSFQRQQHLHAQSDGSLYSSHLNISNTMNNGV